MEDKDNQAALLATVAAPMYVVFQEQTPHDDKLKRDEVEALCKELAGRAVVHAAFIVEAAYKKVNEDAERDAKLGTKFSRALSAAELEASEKLEQETIDMIEKNQD